MAKFSSRQIGHHRTSHPSSSRMMFEFHGFDPKTLSNEQLFEKQLQLTTKKIMAARFGKVDSVNQLQMMIQAIEFERRERMFQERIGNVVLASSPVVIETEVDLQSKEPTEEEI